MSLDIIRNAFPNQQKAKAFPKRKIASDNPFIFLRIFSVFLQFFINKALSNFSAKTYGMCTHWKHLNEMLPMSTHNICFHKDMRK